MGVCLGGHLAYRATLNSKIKSAFCLSATDIHSNTLPVEKAQQSLARMAEIEGEVHFVWSKQDSHVPHEGRLAIYNKLYSDGGFGVCINRPRGWSRDNK